MTNTPGPDPSAASQANGRGGDSSRPREPRGSIADDAPHPEITISGARPQLGLTIDDTALPDLDLAIAPDGLPHRPLVVLELDPLRDAPYEVVERAAQAAARALPLTIGVLRGTAVGNLGPLLVALTLTVTDRRVSPLLRQVVEVDDIDEALVTLTTAVARSPRAAIACGQLLRQTIRLETTQALAAEAAAYSMLLGGIEFHTWLAERGPARTVHPPERDLVRLTRRDSHLSIVLDHPERRNALGARLREQLLDAALLAEADPSIGSIDMSGAGPAFCSGGDLDEFGTAADLVAAYLVRLDRAPWAVFDRIATRLRIHTHGACIGAGVELAAFAATVTAAPDTYFRFPEIHMGLIPGAGGTVSVPRRVGRWRAAWLMLTGLALPARGALDWGLVDRIVPDPDAPPGPATVAPNVHPAGQDEHGNV
ncbi:enoyl-CoA hydratase/isomerase family protein [Nocardia alni]|uniref:enoyl-CoA hydratase/isomerase family protein n=1 Tax=Nocardia alni TaxID=2815723 RepID=UPI001C222B03|nr:enoyl-CoA hydratase/isomerase family protein [Nocardia alni]